jgi:[glutamine synthetase] adenylyltransferase / [glutamine synthetase]-adenylyl-L-tyrosine phosphorylase
MNNPLNVCPALQRQVDLFWEKIRQHPDLAAELKPLLLDNPPRLAIMNKLLAVSEYAGMVCQRKPALLLSLLGTDELECSRQQSGQLINDLNEIWHQQTESVPQNSWRTGEVRLKRILRDLRQREMLRILWRDIGGLADLAETCRDLSDLADVCLQFAIQILSPWCQQEWGMPVDDEGQPQQMVVLGMGKYGARELNLSSDIDLIFAYPSGGETVALNQDEGSIKPRLCTNQTFFVKLGQRLIDVLDTVTEDGFVFRVDMRLRPYGGAGALAMSFDALEEYYQSQGRDWERFAMIKVRPVAGDLQAGLALLESLRPFVYRRYLDFATIEALRDMKRLINQQVRRKGMEDNIKLGAGGIREVEFIVQVMQLIHGGRRRQLQMPSLLGALDALAEAGYLAWEDAEDLRQCYVFLRNLEHKLQALDDRQTQQLPTDDGSRVRVALAMGFEDWQALLVALDNCRGRVSQHFHEIIREEANASNEAAEDEMLLGIWLENVDQDEAIQKLTQLGYKNPQSVLELIHHYRASRQFLSLEKTARDRLERFMTCLLELASQGDDPDLGFARVFNFAQSVMRRTAYLVLLLENSLAFRQLLDLGKASPWIVEHLSKYPVLLDELLKPLSAPPGREELMADLRQQLLRIPQHDFDQQMECLRYFKQAHVLKVAAADLAQTMPLMKVSDYLSFIAEAVLEHVLQLSWEHLVALHGYPVNLQGEAGQLDFTVIGYGKLGGIELNYGSDLDLVFLHDADPEQDTQAGNGQRAISSAAFYAKLGQRMMTMLNTATISGRLYEVDMRLRPSGASGLLVSSLQAFSKYQHENAWTWEHQALVRARAVAGSQRLASAFAGIRNAVLALPRDDEKLRHDVSHMRRRMREELGTPSALQDSQFHLKHDSGGIVDIEFIVQYLVLANANALPQLLAWSDNMRLLDTASALGLLLPDAAETLKSHYITYRGTLHKQALQNASNVLPGQPYQQERQDIRRIWATYFPADGSV